MLGWNLESLKHCLQEAELEMDEEDLDVIRNMDRETEESDEDFFTEQTINAAKYVCCNTFHFGLVLSTKFFKKIPQNTEIRTGPDFEHLVVVWFANAPDFERCNEFVKKLKY